MKLTDDQRAELEAVLNREGCAPGSSLHSWRCEDKDRYPEPCDCVAGVVDELAPLIEGWMSPAPCEMTHTPPFDFAQCETHDETFPLGGECRFKDREPWEVHAEEADEQRQRAVLAEMLANDCYPCLNYCDDERTERLCANVATVTAASMAVPAPPWLATTPRPMTVGQLTAEHVGKRLKTRGLTSLEIVRIKHCSYGVTIVYGARGDNSQLDSDTPCEVLDD